MSDPKEPFEWQCSQCTFINSKFCQICAVCDFKLENEHQKAIKNFKIDKTKQKHNSKSSKNDENCSNDCEVIEISPKSGKTIPNNRSRTVVYENLWLCYRCTFATNPVWARVCELCNASRNMETPKAPDIILLDSKIDNKPNLASDVTKNSLNEWSCEICGHRNLTRMNCCEMCESKIENILEDTQMIDSRSVLKADFNSASMMNTSFSCKSEKAVSTSTTYTNASNQAEKIWNNIVKYCKLNNHKFIDDSFPPCDKSLFIDPKKRPSSLANRRVLWLSPEQIRTDANENRFRWTVYNNPQFGDIKQGLLGNCWLLSGTPFKNHKGLAVILEQPELLNEIIITKDYCAQGCYLVRLCLNGEWQTVILDDVFPCDSNGHLLYSKAARRQLWVPLIEKAMAKLNGSYDSLIAGHTVEGMSALTGYPCDWIRLEKPASQDDHINNLEVIWAQLLSMKESGYALGASCGHSSIKDDAVFKNFGLLPRHAYSILDVREIAGYRLLRLRNPWGRYSWTGDWSHSSSKWTSELRKLLKSNQTQQGRNENEEGVFWMSFPDFVKYFSSIDICKTRLDWFESRMQAEFCHDFSTEMTAFHLIVFETAEINVTLFHKTNKNRRENSDLDLCFVVFQSTGSGSVDRGSVVGKLVKASRRSIAKFISLEHIFEPGEYVVVPFSLNFWHTTNQLRTNDNDINLYNLVFHSAKTFFIEKERHGTHLLADALIQLCVTLGKRTYAGMENANIYTLTSGYSGLIVVVENFNEREFVHVELDCSNSSNVVSTRLCLVTKDSVPPLHRQCLLVLSHLEGSANYQIDFSMKYRLSSNRFLNTWPGSAGLNVRNYPEIKSGSSHLHSIRSVFL